MKNGRFSAEERLERTQVHDGRIGFDLTEVRVHGCRQIQSRRDGVLHVDADGQVMVRTVLQRIPQLQRRRAHFSHDVRNELQSLRRPPDA